MTRASDTAKLLGAGATILDGTTISTADNSIQLSLTSTDADADSGPELELYRNSASPADADVAGVIAFKSENSAGETISYGNINLQLGDVTDGTEDGTLSIQTIVGGTVRDRVNFRSSGVVFNDGSVDTDFRVESNGNANMLFVDGGNNMVGIGTNAPHDLFSVKGVSGATTDISFSGGDDTNDIRLFLGGDSNPFNGQIIYEPDNNVFKFATSGSEHMRIDSSGNLLVGTTSADSSGQGARLKAGGRGDFTVSGGACSILNRTSSDGTILNLQQASNSEGSISVSGSTVSYNAFSGSHWSRLTDNSKPTILKGTIIETIDEMCDWYQAEITIPKTDDKDEYKIKESIALPSGKKVGDTISHTYEGVTYDNVVIIKEADNKHTKCKISDTADSKRVYGVHADWDNDDDTVNDMYVTAVGTHVVRINKDVTVSAGDLLSSNGDGTAKVQDDDIIRSKTIGKVLTNIKQETYDDGSYTVPCALYCG